jgi:hypothetical protein
MLENIHNDPDESDDDAAHNDAISDDDLRARGLTKVMAWVEDKSGIETKSKAAGRTSRHRQKLAALGIVQFNLDAPAADDARAALKAAAAALINGQLDSGTLHTVALGAVPDQGAAEGLSADLAACQRALEAGGWRGWAVRRLVGIA